MKKVKERTVSVKLSEDLYIQIKELANSENRFITALMDKAVANYLKAKKVAPEA